MFEKSCDERCCKAKSFVIGVGLLVHEGKNLSVARRGLLRHLTVRCEYGNSREQNCRIFSHPMYGISFYIVLMLIVLAIKKLSEKRRERRVLMSLDGGPLRLERPTDPSPQGASIYEEILLQDWEHASKPLNYERFPKIPHDSADGFYSPGERFVLRARTTSPEPTAWQRVYFVIKHVSNKKITDWRVLEQNVIDVDPDDNVDLLLAHLQTNDVPATTVALFLTMARQSSSYRGVIWGITIGSINLPSVRIKDLLTLGRHSELTPYVCIALRREAMRDGAFAEGLSDLQRIAYDWGAIQATHSLIHLESTKADRTLRRDVVVHAMRNGLFLRTELAVMLVEKGVVNDLVSIALNDAELREGLVDLVESITLQPEVPGPLREIENAELLVESIINNVASWPADIATLVLLRSIGIFLTFDTKVEWEHRERWLEKMREIYFEILTLDALRDAITEDHRRNAALAMVVEVEATDLLPEVLDDFHKRPERINIDVLGRLGNHQHLRALLEAIPGIVNLEARPSLERNAEEFGNEENRVSYLYASIVSHLGRLGTPEALAYVRSAGRDPHPWARTAAMEALNSLQRWTLDKSSKELVRICLGDEIDYVRDAARSTADYHQLNASLQGSGYTPSFPAENPLN